MLDATRKAEELIEPQLQLEVVNAESDVFTLNTKPSHPQASLGEAATVETWSQGLADDLDLPEQVAGGRQRAKCIDWNCTISVETKITTRLPPHFMN